MDETEAKYNTAETDGPPPQPLSQEAAAQGMGENLLGHMHNAANNPLSCLILIIAGSAAIMVQASIECSAGVCEGELAYAVAVGVVSLIFGLLYLLMTRQNEASMTDLMHLIFSFFMFVWWGVAVGVLTFDAPYVATSNAYFGAWAGFCGSFFLVYQRMTQFRDAVDKALATSAKILSSLLLSSIIELVASFGPCSAKCKGENAFALSVGIVSVVVVLLMLLVGLPENVRQWLNTFLALWWVAGAGVLTFYGPFLVTGNGYFATWFSLFAALKLLATNNQESA